jgi:hypothetical protein
MRPTSYDPDDVADQPAHLPEIVAIDELSPRALDAAAAEIAEELEEEAPTWPTATA